MVGGNSVKNPVLNDKVNPPLLDNADGLSDEELFRRAMAGVKPIASFARRRLTVGNENPGQGSAGSARDAGLELLEQLVSGETDIDWTSAAEYVEGGSRRWDPLLLKKLHTGGFSIQAELDLHGLSQREARTELAEFIKECTRRRLNCVRIVHGKGKNSRNHVPVLKQKIQEWLSLKRLARYVVAYTSARPVDGGVGAIYVLLRKPRTKH